MRCDGCVSMFENMSVHSRARLWEAQMDLTWSPEEEAFRAEVRGWLEANLPKENKALGEDEFDDDPASFEFRRDWQRTLGEAGYLAMHWPKEYGGGGRTLV